MEALGHAHRKIFYYFRFLAVLAAALKAFAVGAPLVPGLRIVSFDPALMRFLLAAMLAYSPFFGISISSILSRRTSTAFATAATAS